MQLIQRVRLRDVRWGPLVSALLLTAFGVAFVISACYDPEARLGLGREAQLQLGWWAVAVTACISVMHVPLATWKAVAIPGYVACIGVQFLMIAAAGTALVPQVKGAHNWIVIGPLRGQPSEFIKLGVLLCCARVLTMPGFVVQRFSHVAGAMAVAGVPAAIMAKEDLGSALTFPPMILGMLFAAGMRLRHLALILTMMATVVLVGVAMLPREGPKAYQYQRIQAWLNPDEYATTEGYQTIRSIRSIGSGQWVGKGYAAGDQNRLGWLPEKHTDMIFAVVGEEVGFVGSGIALLLFLAFGWSGIYTATQCRDGFARCVVGGFTCLVMGQMGINLAVALGLMPVTGITLPFFSYGGSSLLCSYLGVGLMLSAAITARGSNNSRIGMAGISGRQGKIG